MTGECLSDIPRLLADMTFIVKDVIKLIIEELDIEAKKKFIKELKKIIYEKTNNIIGLSIISNIGLTYYKELPGYCLELISELKIVHLDLIRNIQLNS